MPVLLDDVDLQVVLGHVHSPARIWVYWVAFDGWPIEWTFRKHIRLTEKIRCEVWVLVDVHTPVFV